jgi:aspartyl-tRNA(Asn)/glutamyl-tRNA(Gln) amidotransferase subunit C
MIIDLRYNGLCYNETSFGFVAKEGYSEVTAKLTTADVRDIAELAKLDLSDAEIAMYTEQLSQILDYFTLLQEVDTSHIDMTDSVLPLRSVMRADILEAALTPEQVIANAPDAEANQFKVSAVLGDE